MNLEKFNPSNPEYQRTIDFPQGDQASFKDVEGGFVREGAIENKAEALDLVNMHINKEVEEIINERDLGDLSVEEYVKIKKEAIERVIEQMKMESADFSFVVSEAEKKIEEESGKVVSVLEKNGASEEEVNGARRGFLKMLGLGAAVATAGMAFSNKAEAFAHHSLSEAEKAIGAIGINNEYIRTLLSLSDDDIKSINEGMGYSSNSTGDGVSESFENRKKGVVSAAVIGLGVGSFMSSALIFDKEGIKPAKEIAKSTSAMALGFSAISVLASLLPAGGRLDNLVSEHGGHISKEIILQEIKRVETENARLLTLVKKHP